MFGKNDIGNHPMKVPKGGVANGGGFRATGTIRHAKPMVIGDRGTFVRSDLTPKVLDIKILMTNSPKHTMRKM